MKYGVFLWPIYRDGLPYEAYRAVARHADSIGFESVWTGHHAILPTDAVNDPRTGSASDHDAFQHRLDPLMLLADLANATERVRLGTAIFLLPLTNVFLTARSVLTADIISNGRIIFGTGVGWCREEYELVGEDFATRGRRADEMVEVLKKLWRDDVTEHKSDVLSFGPVGFEPKPVQRPRPPILGGGSAPSALRRAARLDGAYLTTEDVDEVKAHLAVIRDERQRLGIAHEPFEVTITLRSPEPDGVLVERLAEAGVDRLVVQADGMRVQPRGTVPEATIDGMKRRLDQYARTLPLWEGTAA